MFSCLIILSVIYIFITNKHANVSLFFLFHYQLSCSSSFSNSNHTHYAEGCSEYSTYSFITDFIPSFLYPHKWPIHYLFSQLSYQEKESSIEIKGNDILSFTCPSNIILLSWIIDGLQQAKLLSIVEEGNQIEEWLQQNNNQREIIERLYQDLKERYKQHNYVTQSYQPVDYSYISHILVNKTKENSFWSLSLSM